MALVIDLTNYRDTEGDRLPAGNYLVRVSDTELTESKAGNPMVNLFLEVLLGETSGTEFAGSSLVDRVTVTPKAMFRVVAFMKAVGEDTGKRQHTVDPSRWIGKIGVVAVEDGESYMGRPPRTEVRAWQHVRSHAWVDLTGTGPATAAGGGNLDDLMNGLEDDGYEEDAAPVSTAEVPSDYAQTDIAETAPAPATSGGMDLGDDDDEIDLDALDLDAQD